MSLNRNEIIKIIVAIIIPNAGAWLITLFSRSSYGDWYNSLELPPFKPPTWLFAPAWTIIYSLIGFGSYLVYRDGEGWRGSGKLPLSIYIVKLILNWIWTPIFFGLHAIGWVSTEKAFYFCLINKT